MLFGWVGTTVQCEKCGHANETGNAVFQYVLGYKDGLVNREKRSRAPKYLEGYENGHKERPAEGAIPVSTD